MKLEEDGLVRSIGVWGLTANIVNVIVGAGIFVLPAIVAANMGKTGILAYLFCGFLITLVMLCFAEAGSKVNNSGGGYTYIETAFGKFPGFIFGFIYLLGTFTADGAVANALIGVLGAVAPIFKNEYVRILSLFIIFFGLAGINILGIKQGIGVVKLLTITKLTPLLLLVIIGWKDVSGANLYWNEFPTWESFGATCLILFFAFQGAEIGLTVGGEILNPKRTIPRAVILSIVVVLIFYILIQTVSQGVMGSSLADYPDNPLAETGKVVFGPIGYMLLFMGAAISMLGFMSGELLNNPRLVFALGRDRVVPITLLTRIHKRFRTSYVAILIYATIGFCISIFGGFKELAIIATGAVLLLYVGVSLSVIKLRRGYISERGEFKIPGGLTVPILSLIICLYFLSNLSRNEMLITFLYLVVLSLIYFVIQYFEKKKLRSSH